MLWLRDVGIVRLSAENLKGKQYQDYTVLGKLVIDPAVELEQLKKVFRSVKVFGKVKCSDAIKDFYGL